MARYGMTAGDFIPGRASQAFTARARQLLQVKSARHYVHGYKHGKVATSRLWRVGLPPVDSGEWNSRVFKRRTAETDLLDTAIFVLSDASGSMGGVKYQTAAKASSLINDAFGNVLHVPLSIAAFSSFGDTPVIGIMKGFNERVNDTEMAARFEDFLHNMSGNNDADTLLWAYHEILKRPEKRKIIIVLSDGSPADGIGDPYYALETVTKEILKDGRVDLYGIGIMDRNVEHFYPKHKVINNISELENALVDVLSKALTKEI
jgi:cobalamin biosynthesis protein CobT